MKKSFIFSMVALFAVASIFMACPPDAPEPVLLPIEKVVATDGTVTITLKAKPTTPPKSGDFTATQKIGSGKRNPLPLENFDYDDDVTVTYTFSSIGAAATDQSVVIAVKYGSGTAVSAEKFIILMGTIDLNLGNLEHEGAELDIYSDSGHTQYLGKGKIENGEWSVSVPASAKGTFIFLLVTVFSDPIQKLEVNKSISANPIKIIDLGTLSPVSASPLPDPTPAPTITLQGTIDLNLGNLEYEGAELYIYSDPPHTQYLGKGEIENGKWSVSVPESARDTYIHLLVTVFSDPKQELKVDKSIRADPEQNIDLGTLPEPLSPEDILVPPQAPQAPTLIAGSGQIALSWEKVERASLYEIWGGITDNVASAECYNVDISGTGATTITTTIANLKYGASYSIWIKAKNSAGASDFSPPGTATTFTNPVLSLETPTVTFKSRELTVTWQSVPEATAYEVSYREINSPDSPKPYGGDITGTRITLTGLTNWTTYQVFVRAKNDTGIGALSQPGEGTPAELPAKPEKPTVSVTDAGLMINWAQRDHVVSYHVLYGKENNPDIAKVYDNSNPEGNSLLSVTVPNPENGTLYYVWVQANNVAGSVINDTPATALIKPAAPGLPKITPRNGYIEISWDPVYGATSHEVWYGELGQSLQKYNDYTGTSATIYGLTNGIPYLVQLKAKNVAEPGTSGGGTSEFGPSMISTPEAVPGPPAPTVIADGTRALFVSWIPVEGTNIKYDLYYSTTPTCPSSPQITDLTATNTRFTGLADGTWYYIWVRSKNSSGLGSLSQPARGLTIPATPATPTISAGNTQLHISWSTVSSVVDYYEVWYSSSNNSASATKLGETSENKWDTDDLSNTTYYVWIKAVNNSTSSQPGKSAFSSGASGKPSYTWRQLGSYTSSQTVRLSTTSTKFRDYEVYLLGAGGGGQGNDYFSLFFSVKGTGTGAGGGGGGVSITKFTTSYNNIDAELIIGDGGAGGDGNVTIGYQGNDGGSTSIKVYGFTTTAYGGQGGGKDGYSPYKDSFFPFYYYTLYGGKGGSGNTLSGSRGDDGDTANPNSGVRGGKSGSVTTIMGTAFGGGSGGTQSSLNGTNGGGGAGAAYGTNNAPLKGGYGGKGMAQIFYLEHN
jgi:hypothetical protein